MIELEEIDGLVDPVVIAAFEGWNDAADAASSAVDHLMRVWNARIVGAIDPDEFYDFQVNRPMVGSDPAGHRRITWPGTTLAIASPPDLDRDIILLRGIEPNMKWRQFCAELLAACDDLGGRLVVTLGALLADTPHTRPIPVSGTATEPELVDRLKLEQSTYEGPTGIVGVLQDACARLDIPAVSYWAAVPHYVAQPPCPKATLALLGQLEDLLEASIPLGDLPEDARAWERGVDELAEEDEDVADYVRSLEETRDTTELPEASGEAIAREFERYLKRRNGDDSPAEVSPRVDRVSSASPSAASSSACMVSAASSSEVSARWPVLPRVASTQACTAATARGASRSSAMAASTSVTTGAAGAPAPSDSARRQSARASTASQSSLSSHSQSERKWWRSSTSRIAIGSTSLLRSAEMKTRLPFDFDIFSPS